MHVLRKISAFLLLGLYGLIVLHGIVPHDHTSQGKDIAADHHHDHHNYSHDHGHHHNSGIGDFLRDLFVSLLNTHNDQFDSEETHFQTLKPSQANTLSVFNTQFHLYTPYQNHCSPPTITVNRFELYSSIWVINDYSVFHSLRAPPLLV